MGATSNKESLLKNILNNRAIPVLLVIAFLISGFMGWIYWNRFQKIISLRAEIAELREKKDELSGEISKLLEKRNKRNDLDYIESLAREELGLTYPPGEKSGK